MQVQFEPYKKKHDICKKGLPKEPGNTKQIVSDNPYGNCRLLCKGSRRLVKGPQHLGHTPRL